MIIALNGGANKDRGEERKKGGPVKRAFWAVFLSFSLLCSISCKEQAQQPDSKIQVIIEGGIQIIKNPEAPLYGHVEFEVQEDLSIGTLKDENYFFYRNTYLDVDHKGNVYVLDGGNKRVQVFSNEGIYLRTVGSEGQGPGEFGSTDGIFINKSNGSIYVSDNNHRRFTIFLTDGTYSSSVPFVEPNRYFCVDPGGYILLERGIGMRPTYFCNLVLINETGASEKLIESRPDQVAKVIEGKKAGFFHGYEHRFQFNVVEAIGFIWGFSSDYDFNVIDCQGNLLYRIQKESPKVPIPEREKDIVRDRFRDSPIKDLNNIPFPDHNPLFGRILTDRGWIFVSHFRSPIETKAEYSMDVFNQQGYFLYTCDFPINPLLIKNGCAYLIDTSDETGDIKIMRYKIMNWSQLKKK